MNEKRRNAKYPFVTMRVGEQTYVPDQGSQGKAAMAARMHGRNSGKRFATRTVGDGVYIWRVD